MPSEKAQYIHRLGRTGRAGKQGGGYLLLTEEERPFLKMIRDLPVAPRQPLETAAAAKLAARVQESMMRVSPATKQASYQAWLGFYNTFTKRLGWSKEEVVRRANTFATTVLGLTTPPAIEAKTVGKMGLSGTPGLVYGTGQPKGGYGGSGGRGGGGGKGGSGLQKTIQKKQLHHHHKHKGKGGKGGGGKGNAGGGKRGR